jgi:hypothetical protein
MNRKWLYVVMGAALTLGVQAVNAQEPPPGPPPHPDMMGGPDGPIGPRMELLGFGEMHPGKVVTGAPYSAVGVTETKQTLSDGNVIDRKVNSNVYRDSQGRTRRETTFSGAGPLAASGQPHTMIMIHDPVAGTGYVLHAEKKTAEQLPTHPHAANRAENLQSKFEARIQEEIANGTLKKEDLGTQTIEGVSAQGTRYTHIIAAGKIGNANAISVVNEQWYSPDLQVIVKTTRTDPRFGTTTYTLTNIQRTEPAASLFTVPSDYSVKQSNERRGMRRGVVPPPPGDAAPADTPAAPGE